MVSRGPLHVDDLLDRRRLEPGKFVTRERQLFIIDRHPEAMPGYIRDFSCQSVVPGIDDLLLAGFDDFLRELDLLRA